VAVPIDTSEPLLFNADLAKLVGAVMKADPHGEHDWIEWKRRLDLSTKNAQEHIAKHVLGFANRTVQAAALHMGGYGYILIGVEPGSVTGVETIDPATLTNAILRYVGPDGPRYNSEYVPFDGHHVLVVVVRSPKHGDPIHTLRHQLAQHRPGRVLVRRIGETEEASPSEHAALVERAKANANTITVTARVLHETIDCLPADLPQQLDAAIDAERALLMHPNRSTRPVPNQAPPSSWLAGPPRASFGPALGPRYEEDGRTEGEYADEVETYLERLRPVLQQRAGNRQWRRPSGMLHLALDNLTPRNFAQVWLRVHVSGRVRQGSEEPLDLVDYPGDLPPRPRRLGERRRLPSLVDAVLQPRGSGLPLAPFDHSFQSPGYSTRDGGSVDIDFEPVHLHPHTPTDLPSVPLLVDEPAGTTLRITWKATSESADGLASGEVNVVVVEPQPIDDLLPSDEGRSR